MKQITEDYVSFETAKLLKYKGADFDTDQVYTSMGRAWKIDMKQFKKQFGYEVSNYIQRPTLQMAMKWLRERNIDIIPFHEILDDDVYWCRIEKKYGNLLYTELQQDPVYKTYEEAAEEAIKYCLEKLI